jgi:2,5-dihydroxypyridine 5,6-dioxygenase
MLPDPRIAPELAGAADALVRDYMAVRGDDTVLITADTQSDMAAVEAVMNSADAAGARPAVMVIPQLPFQGALADPYINPTLAAAAKSCDVWLDFTFPYIAGAHIQDEAMKAGKVRYFLGGDMGSGGLARLFGKVDLDRYYAVHKAFDEIVVGATGKTVRITNGLGSDVSFALAKPGFAKPRRADKPGMYLVPGSCTMFPELESVRGVLHVGAAFHEYFTPLATPLTLKVDGKIREVTGGGPERRVMDRALKRAGGGEYGYVIHFTHGIHPAARITGKSFIEDMRVIGNDAVGMGLPWWVPGGGENHPDAILFQQSIWIDGKKIVEDGAIVGPSSLAKLAEELQPLYH